MGQLAQRGLHGVGEDPLVARDAGDVDERGGERDGVGGEVEGGGGHEGTLPPVPSAAPGPAGPDPARPGRRRAASAAGQRFRAPRGRERRAQWPARRRTARAVAARSCPHRTAGHPQVDGDAAWTGGGAPGCRRDTRPPRARAAPRPARRRIHRRGAAPRPPRGEVVAVRRGAYVPSTDERLDDPAARHALAVRAAVAQLPAGAVDQPRLGRGPPRPPRVGRPARPRCTSTRDRTSGGRSRAAPAPAHHSPGRRRRRRDRRRAGDRTGPHGGRHGAGGAVRRRRRRRGRGARSRPRPGRTAGGGRTCRAAARQRPCAAGGGLRRRVADAASASRAAGSCWPAAGLPPPVLQWPVHGPQGRHVGTTDFGWPELGTVGEFDGLVKYGRLLRPGQSPGDAVVAEKRREDAAPRRRAPGGPLDVGRPRRPRRRRRPSAPRPSPG